MHTSDETTGHEPAEVSAETHATDLSDEALDRALGKGGASSFTSFAKDPAVMA